MNRLGIEALSMLGLPPVESVELAADLGCGHISLMLQSLDFSRYVENERLRPGESPLGYPPYDLSTDPRLRRDLAAVLADRGISVSIAEGLSLRPGSDARDRSAELDVFAELGAKQLNLVSWDPDLGRTCGQFAEMMELAQERGMTGLLEFLPGLVVPDLGVALEVIRRVGHPELRLLIDAMHFIRSGGTVDALAAVEPELIGYFQICDAPLHAQMEPYLLEAIGYRRVPGKGELPLAELLALVPRDRIVSLEIPMLEPALAGVGPRERLRPAVEATEALLSGLA